MFNELRRFDEWSDGDPGSLLMLVDAQEASGGLVGLFGLCGLVIAILSIVWWYQAYTAIAGTTATGRSWTPGWAVGGWFIPLGNLIIPKLVLDEIDRVSAAAEDGNAETWRVRPRLRSAGLWWGCFVVASVLLGIGRSITTGQLAEEVTSAVLYRRGLWLTGTGLALDVVAALFAVPALRVLGGRLTRR